MTQHETFAQECARLRHEPGNERQAAQLLAQTQARRTLRAHELRAAGQRCVTTRTGIVIGGAHTRPCSVRDGHALHGPYRRPRQRLWRGVLGTALALMVVLPLLWALLPAVRHATGVLS